VSRHRFYADPKDISGKRVVLSADQTHHLVRVLRMSPGDEAFVFDGCGEEFRCRFTSLSDRRALLDIIDTRSDRVESAFNLTLGLALMKGEKVDLVIQKATELGVTSIVPLVTDHADVKLSGERIERRVERWKRVSLESMKQCGRRKLVDIAAPLSLDEYLRVASTRRSLTQMLVFSTTGGIPLNEALDRLSERALIVALIGPEAGWSNNEAASLEALGSVSVSLGPRILRAETAAIVALALLQHELGDM
jgi:16S rRNA (uracil1498-N3)-methyltransferase